MLWLPLFPLQVVLVPGADLPLHIFEDRYKQMIAAVRDPKSEFGVVLASGNGLSAVGCTATVEKILKEYPDGRMDILTLGRRRFEISGLNEELPYLRGSVDYITDEDLAASPMPLRERVLESFNALRKLSNESLAEPGLLLHPEFSFRVAAALPYLELRQSLLGIKSETERLQKLVEVLPEFIERQRGVEHVKTIAPRNGHGGKPPTIH
jgi:Lon protease-like protein